MSKANIGRLFIVGTPRSGTTLLQSLLAAHSQIVSLPETWFFISMQPRNPLKRAFRIASSKQRARYEKFLFLIDIPAGIHPPRNPIFVRQYSRAFLRILDSYAQQQGKSIWLEKTPQHIRLIQLIEQCVPGARFIHIVRNGPDNIASLHDVTSKNPDAWSAEWSFEGCIQQWLDDARITLSHAGRPNHFVVGYRQLAAETRPTLVRACEFIGVPFEEAMLCEYARVAERVAPMTDYWRAGAKEAIRNRDGTKFYEIFTEEQRQYILKRVAEVDLTPLDVL